MDAVAPVGIDSQIVGDNCVFRDLLAVLSIPSLQMLRLMFRSEEELVRRILQIEGDIRLGAAAVAVVDEVAEFIGRIVQSIGAIEEELDLSDAPENQAGIDLRTHVAPNAHGAGKFVDCVVAVNQ